MVVYININIIYSGRFSLGPRSSHCLQCFARRQRPAPSVSIASALFITRTIYVLHAENNMPHLLKHPPDAKTIRQLRLRRPLEHTLVIVSRSLQDPFPAYGELSAADIADMLGDLLRTDVEERLVDLREERADVVFFDVNLGRFPRVDTRWATGVMLAAEIDVSLGVDGFETEMGKHRAGPWAEEVVVPLVNVGVDKDGVLRELIVEVYDVGEIGGGLATASCRRDKKVRGGRGICSIDERDCSMIPAIVEEPAEVLFLCGR